MKDPIFPINVGEKQYFMVLPDWEEDYIQGMLVEKAVPYEFAMLQAMESCLRANDLVLDVGANIGNHTLYLAAVAGLRVVAFEPNPELCVPLRQAISLNDLDGRVTLHEVGVGASEGNAHFAERKPENIGGQSLTLDDSDAAPISVISLDALDLEDKVRAIKVDVEGMELSVLKGAGNLISRDKPYLFIEAQTESDFDALHEVVVDLGYIYWDTFNATPTHWFIHSEELGQDAIVDHYFQKGRDSYKLRLAKRDLQTRLNEANMKYRSANERINELKDRLNEANVKYKEATGQAGQNRERMRAEIASLKAELAKCKAEVSGVSAPNNEAHPERALGLDFSLPEEQGKDKG
ncbi:FkbM family methyltransferase [Marinobacter bryozoorum]|uniref:FkbM family methyltransferase n=1 Tax=Marinobacter bryozoorum TaxID=256324 RepID=UPI00200397B5|nr:FkbM family methyltransferase [Marinobacter bryozoorum]MCK7546201.1 FkbM family methyltransferase [Marinobacter bryozoorum]